MVNASKILTVSYGTFSCTLEGFDDPFSTMRSIAEYFRDLAADDRYFGAEPPTPDAEMLHRIAERENRRRVEAQVGDNGVVLRQVEDRNTSTSEPIPETSNVDDVADQPATKALASEEKIEEPEFDISDNSVAAKLARIRAAVARSRTESEPLLNAVFAEDEHADVTAPQTHDVIPVQSEASLEASDDDLTELMDAIASDDTIDGQNESDAPSEDDLTAMLDQAVSENSQFDDEDAENIALDDAPLDLESMPDGEPSEAVVADDIRVNESENDTLIYDDYDEEDAAFAMAAIPEDLREKAPTIVLPESKPVEDISEEVDLAALLNEAEDESNGNAYRTSGGRGYGRRSTVRAVRPYRRPPRS